MSAYSLCKDVSFKRTDRNVFIPYAIFLWLLCIMGIGGEVWAVAPPAPTLLTATMVSSNQINLTWRDNATTESNYYVERSPNGTSSWTVVATLVANVTSFQSGGLAQNTRYYYRVRCIAGGIYSGYSSIANAITAVLAGPTSLNATVASATSIALSWIDNTAYETLYSIERSLSGAGPWTVVGTTKSNTTTYTNSGLTPGTPYYYQVRAYDTTNYSSYSNVAKLTISAITASAGPNGTIIPSGTVGVVPGASQAFAMTPNAGFKISTVTVDGSAVSTNPTYTFTAVSTSHTISVTFSVQTYTITASAGPNGSITPSGAITVAQGVDQTFNIAPNVGYKVDNVLVDGLSKGGLTIYTFPTVTAPHTISATFSTQTFTITAAATANGSITPSGPIRVNYGETPAFTISPISNYHIGDVLVDGVSVGTSPTYTFPAVVSNHTITANFAGNTLILSGVMANSNTLDTNTQGSVSIFFTINATATATLKIIPELLGPAGTPVYQTSQACPTAGAYFFTWDGKDNAGRVVPDEAYLYIIEASDGVKLSSYSPSAPTGAGTVTCSRSSDFDPATNIPMTVTYTPAQVSRVKITIFWGVLTYTVLDAFPATAGGHIFVWDGRSPSNRLLDTSALLSCSIASLLPENFIITTGDTIKITDLKTDPYAMSLSYGQFTRISYTLSRDANVTVKLTSPSGSIRTLVSNQFQAAGPQALEWNGLDTTDPAGMKTLITEEGDYMVSVQAVNPVSGSIATTRANVRIGY